MLAPKKVKWRKRQKGKNRGTDRVGNDVSFGDWGMMSLDRGWITSRQIEAARIAITRKVSRGAKLWIRIFPDKPISKKPAETRMGKGKGAPEEWVAVIRPGRVMYEVSGVDEKTAKEAFRLAAQKLPLATKIIKLNEVSPWQ